MLTPEGQQAPSSPFGSGAPAQLAPPVHCWTPPRAMPWSGSSPHLCMPAIIQAQLQPAVWQPPSNHQAWLVRPAPASAAAAAAAAAAAGWWLARRRLRHRAMRVDKAQVLPRKLRSGRWRGGPAGSWAALTHWPGPLQLASLPPALPPPPSLQHQPPPPHSTPPTCSLRLSPLFRISWTAPARRGLTAAARLRPTARPASSNDLAAWDGAAGAQQEHSATWWGWQSSGSCAPERQQSNRAAQRRGRAAERQPGSCPAEQARGRWASSQQQRWRQRATCEAHSRRQQVGGSRVQP